MNKPSKLFWILSLKLALINFQLLLLIYQTMNIGIIATIIMIVFTFAHLNTISYLLFSAYKLSIINL